jgi:hypothetical protein
MLTQSQNQLTGLLLALLHSCRKKLRIYSYETRLCRDNVFIAYVVLKAVARGRRRRHRVLVGAATAAAAAAENFASARRRRRFVGAPPRPVEICCVA